jgi:hypothetical protein
VFVKIGGTTLRSIGHIGRLQRVLDTDADFITPLDMLAELRDDNRRLVANLRETHGLCDEHGDVASASLLENWIDEAERRAWFLFEATQPAERLACHYEQDSIIGNAWTSTSKADARWSPAARRVSGLPSPQAWPRKVRASLSPAARKPA